MQSLTIASMDNNVGELHTLTTTDTSKLQQSYTNITTAKNSLASPDTNRFIASTTEPATANDGQVWLKIAPTYTIGYYDPEYDDTKDNASTFFSGNQLTVPVLVTDTTYTASYYHSLDYVKTNSVNPVLMYPGKTVTLTGHSGAVRSFIVNGYGTSSNAAFTDNLSITVTGPLKITKGEQYFEHDTDVAGKTSMGEATFSLTKTDTKFNVYITVPDGGFTWDYGNVTVQVTATGTGTGSIIFSRYSADPYECDGKACWNPHYMYVRGCIRYCTDS